MKIFKILIPVYNDWKSVFKLLENIDLQVAKWNTKVSVIIVNDASIESRPLSVLNFKNIESVVVINMKKNQGHARCNATGLKYIFEKETFDYIIPMDGDGEDRPEELNLLFNKSKDYPDKIITANRIKRAEGPLFRLCYFIHKYITLIFTGQLIKFGNYTCLPKIYVKKMIESPQTWSSFSGSLANLTKDRVSIPSIRGIRYFGPSQMSFFNLIKHSLSIIAVFKTTVFIRSFIFLLVYISLTFKSFSVVTVIPILLIFVLLFSTILLSKRENLNQLESSLGNILSIEKIM